jgi:OmpA-OmpF porin, OOP family
MKKTLLLAILSLVMMGEVLAQGMEKNAISAKLLFIDYGRPNSVDGLDVTNGLEIAYLRNLHRYVNLALPLKVGLANVEGDINNRTFASLDGLFQLQYRAKDESRLVPYLMGGGGIVLEEELGSNVQFPVGAGLNIRVGGRSYVNLQGEYRFSQAENRNNMQLGVGYLHRLGIMDADGDGIADSEDDCPYQPGPRATRGCPDRDMDGIPDHQDACPDVAGLEMFAGCPDTDGDGIPDHLDDCPDVPGVASAKGCPDADGDGIPDHQDDCPDEAGLASANGCPDADGDGIPDHQDDCPDEAGLASANGCPDADGDGVPDHLDECPDEPGTAATKGCPDRDGDGFADKDDLCPDVAGEFAGCPDTDGDGVHDGIDACPDQPGLAANKGCPELQREEREVLVRAMRAVQFETGKATLKPESYAVLDQIAAIMTRYPGYKLRISGHTDSVGDDDANQLLSEERAQACFLYLVEQGVAPNRAMHQGFGETQPIASNSRSEGRRRNRRVEFELYLD